MSYEFLKDFAGPAVSLLAVLVTAVIAGFGFRTFDKWKREKIEERRIEVSIDALAIAYEAQFVFEAVRSRFHSSAEYEDGHDEWGSERADDPIRVTLQEGQRTPYVVLKRLQRHEDFFEKVRKIEPLSMAVFGAATQEIFGLLYTARTRLESEAKSLFEEERFEIDREDTESRERRRELRSSIFASPNEKKEGDRIGEGVREFTKQIEEICRPIVDQQFRGRASRKKT